jgi:hypothetical protein
MSVSLIIYVTCELETGWTMWTNFHRKFMRTVLYFGLCYRILLTLNSSEQTRNPTERLWCCFLIDFFQHFLLLEVKCESLESLSFLYRLAWTESHLAIIKLLYHFSLESLLFSLWKIICSFCSSRKAFQLPVIWPCLRPCSHSFILNLQGMSQPPLCSAIIDSLKHLVFFQLYL